ncbi:hypothetical protein HPP92_011021 [Vanilla planifolia]|uniref:Uncharacterized protein n=1 Tax=Vanilla planifolia TaxID=51239 RepID=A0A835RBK8_VANPL|nr:hypothetical protein HPP92_011021 [Vanilla planifolia]
MLSFVKQLGIAPHSNYRDSIEWIQSIAKLVAYRRAVFEEFDDTYAQAFGVQPMRPTPNSMGMLDQPERFTPRVAPLSGPLVVAESLGDRRSSTKLALQKAAKVAKKNKYLLKRREDLPTLAISSLPDVPSASQPPQHYGFLGPLPAKGELPVPNTDSNYILQKREHTLPPQPPPILAAEPSGDNWISKTDALVPPGNSEPTELKNERGAWDPLLPTVPVDHRISPPFHSHVVSAVHYDMEVVEEEKMQKRPRDSPNEINEWKKLKKKKKNDVDADHRSIEPQVRTFDTVVNGPDFVPEEVSVDVNPPPGLDLSMLQLPQLLSDLSSIALDPFYASERGAPSIVRHVLLRFRSLVYQKSLILPTASEPASLAQAPPAEASAPIPREGREQRELVSVKETKEHREPSKPPKPVFRSEDSTKKRGPSGRQEQLAVKKMKKMTQMKALATEKKAAITRKISETQVQQPQQHKDLKEVAGGTAEASKKQELPAPPKVPSPTFLVMKFPPRSTLPSVANLKARFARFGPLDLSATRVYWKSYSCRVLFKYKSDAQSALDFVKNLDLFGQVKVTYFLRDHEVSNQDQTLPDPAKRPTDSSRHDNSQLRPGVPGGLQRSASLSQPRQNPLQPKSILKKPGGDEPGSNGASGPRVKFMLDVDGEPPTVTASGGNGGNGGGQQAISLASVESTIRQTTKGFFVPPPQARPRVLWPLPASDISGPMLSLLLKCNDVVSNVKASLGYNPYHAL